MPDNEKQFEQDIESFLISPAGGWQCRWPRCCGVCPTFSPPTTTPST